MARPIPPPDPVNTTPLVVDEAMQQRDWEPSAVKYQNDMVHAGPTDRPLQSKADPFVEDAFAEPALFVANLVILPYSLVTTPPWTTVGYKAMNMPPTYTAVPPLPPSPPPGK